MSTPTTTTEDEQLRALVTSADPFAEASTTPEHLWARVADGIAMDASAPTTSGTGQPHATFGDSGDGHRPSFVRRHWQAGLLTAAAVATIALAAGTVLPGLAGMSSGDSSTSAGPVATSDEGKAPSEVAPGQSGSDPATPPSRDGSQLADPDGAATDSSGGAADAPDLTLVRSGSVIVGTDDIQGGRDRFVAEVLRMGGTLVSETVTTQGDVGSSNGVARELAYTYPYPTGPGVWLSAKVPAASYDEAMEVARSTGEVVQLQQSSYDVGTQITDVRARIAVLTASLKRLQGLMDEANSVSEVIQLEEAISSRQADLASLLAQQRELADQTEMSQLSLTLMSPQDAHQTVDPEPQLTWWESFVKGLGQFWSWLGQALLIVSPLLIVGAILLWLRGRRRRGPAAPSEGPAPETA